jgi:hypothetical protein
MLGIAFAFVDVAVKRLPAPLVAASALGALGVLSAATRTGASVEALVRAVLPAAGLGAFYLMLVPLPGTGLGAGDA